MCSTPCLQNYCQHSHGQKSSQVARRNCRLVNWLAQAWAISRAHSLYIWTVGITRRPPTHRLNRTTCYVPKVVSKPSEVVVAYFVDNSAMSILALVILIACWFCIIKANYLDRWADSCWAPLRSDLTRTAPCCCYIVTYLLVGQHHDVLILYRYSFLAHQQTITDQLNAGVVSGFSSLTSGRILSSFVKTHDHSAQSLKTYTPLPLHNLKLG